jgi:hypothetical protein
LVATIMQATGKYDWWLGRGYSPVDTDVAQVSCLLLKQLKAKTDSAEIALYFVMQYGGSHIVELPDQPSYAKTVLGCAENLEIPTINTWKPLHDARQHDPAGFKSLFVMHNEGTVYGHMSSAGNALVAQLVADRIRQSAKH